MSQFNIVAGFSVAVLALCAFSFPQDETPATTAEFSHQALHVRDIQKSASFYETVLGLKRVPDPFKDDRRVWFRMGDRAQLHLIGGAEEVATPDIDVHIAFRVPSVLEFANKLDGLQIRYVNSSQENSRITVRPDRVKQVYFQDPDGYWIEVNDERF